MLKLDTNSKMFLAQVAKSIDEDGWVSRGKSKTTGAPATVDRVLDQRDAWEDDDAAHYIGSVEAALEWCAERFDRIDDLNDYELKAVSSLYTSTADGWELKPDIAPRGVALAGSIVYVAEREAQRAAHKHALSVFGGGGHYGTVGDKFTLSNVIILEVRYLAKWDCHLHKFTTEDHNILTWMTKRKVGEVGTTVLRLSGTVKSHRVWDGIKETQLTRCKAIC